MLPIKLTVIVEYGEISVTGLGGVCGEAPLAPLGQNDTIRQLYERNKNSPDFGQVD